MNQQALSRVAQLGHRDLSGARHRCVARQVQSGGRWAQLEVSVRRCDATHDIDDGAGHQARRRSIRHANVDSARCVLDRDRRATEDHTDASGNRS
jgi:hypothetical protein